MSLYYEAHVTIAPVFDDRLELFKEIAARHQFRVADLLMKKRADDTPEMSQYDSFCTGRDTNMPEILRRIACMVCDLQLEGFDVWRYKLEDTLIDSRTDDTMLLLRK